MDDEKQRIADGKSLLNVRAMQQMKMMTKQTGQLDKGQPPTGGQQ